MNAAIKSRLTEFNQQHLIQFYDELNLDARRRLDAQISSIDFEQVDALYRKFCQTDAWADLAQRAEPPTALRLHDESLKKNSASRNVAIQTGREALSAGQIGMILVAGGQGSRLGFEHPKGMYPLSPVTNRTLFQIHIDKLKAINATCDCTVPLYVMTSPATHRESEEFLNRHHWFGYPEDAATIFCQGTMPAVDCESGKVLLADKDRVFTSPDGHGGMLAALEKNGCLNDMKLRNLRQIFYCQVDNPLSQICDSTTIGYHILAEAEMSSQAVPKLDPLQQVGNIVSIDGKVQIIEYSDLPEDVARRTNLDKSLTFWAGNIAVHVFDVAFLNRMTGHADALPFHLAHKKVPFIGKDGNLVKPDQPNAVKFERFIFDLLPMAKHSIVVEVDPADAFSPVKNAASESSNTAHTARQSMIAQARRILGEVGVKVAEGVAIEIDPRLIYDRQKLKAVTDGITFIDEPTFLGMP